MRAEQRAVCFSDNTLSGTLRNINAMMVGGWALMVEDAELIELEMAQVSMLHVRIYLASHGTTMVPLLLPGSQPGSIHLHTGTTTIEHQLSLLHFFPSSLLHPTKQDPFPFKPSKSARSPPRAEQ